MFLKNAQVNFHGLKPVVFSGTGEACPTSLDTSIYALKPVELRMKIKGKACFGLLYLDECEVHLHPTLRSSGRRKGLALWCRGRSEPKALLVWSIRLQDGAGSLHDSSQKEH